MRLMKRIYTLIFLFTTIVGYSQGKYFGLTKGIRIIDKKEYIDLSFSIDTSVQYTSFYKRLTKSFGGPTIERSYVHWNNIKKRRWSKNRINIRVEVWSINGINEKWGKINIIFTDSSGTNLLNEELKSSKRIQRYVERQIRKAYT